MDRVDNAVNARSLGHMNTAVLAPMEKARLAFLQEVRRWWAYELFPRLRMEYEQAVSQDCAKSVDAGTVLAGLPSHPLFAWMERNCQKLKWLELAEIVCDHWTEISEQAAEGDGPSTLELDPERALPDWYTGVDIHCQPGGVWSADQNAYVYELGARILHLGRNDRLELHDLFAQLCFPPIGEGERVVDLGCGFGKSTRPLARRYPLAEVVGLDLAPGVLRLGCRRANEEGLRIRFVQADASNPPFEDASCAAVTGTMLLHELPREVLEQVLRRAARLLRPGGVIRFLEFMPTGDAFRDACMREHALRNNEPFLLGLVDYPAEVALHDAGLVDVAWVPFDEQGRGPCPGGVSERQEWHFPWTVLYARKPLAMA